MSSSAESATIITVDTFRFGHHEHIAPHTTPSTTASPPHFTVTWCTYHLIADDSDRIKLQLIHFFAVVIHKSSDLKEKVVINLWMD